MNIDKPQKKRMPGASFVVKQEETIESMLQRNMQGKSKTSMKQLLQNGAIMVGKRDEKGKWRQRTLKKLTDIVTVGETVFVGKKPEPEFQMPKGLRVAWEDRWLLVVKKETGLLTVGNMSEPVECAQTYLDAYMQFKKEGGRVYVVHRIDRDTSGVLIFAKNEETQMKLRSNWNEVVLSRRYVAIVEGCPRQKEGTIDTWIEENERTMTMFVSSPGHGKRAITHYKLMKTIEKDGMKYSMMSFELETGRKNQIRIHTSHIGIPIAGDGKYGAVSDPIGRLCLHAQQIEFEHPETGEVLNFTSELPKEFEMLMGRD
ncbi:MAG: RluA family pseudouridine synthase [Bacteroidales bacterium]|nr:RluA family pseudouridine synthase [Bacteroidales bacterium]